MTDVSSLAMILNFDLLLVPNKLARAWRHAFAALA